MIGKLSGAAWSGPQQVICVIICLILFGRFLFEMTLLGFRGAWRPPKSMGSRGDGVRRRTSPGQQGRGAGHGGACPQGVTGLACCQASLYVLPNKSRVTFEAGYSPSLSTALPPSGSPESPWPWQVRPAEGCRAAVRAGSSRSRAVCHGEQAGSFSQVQ